MSEENKVVLVNEVPEYADAIESAIYLLRDPDDDNFMVMFIKDTNAGRMIRSAYSREGIKISELDTFLPHIPPNEIANRGSGITSVTGNIIHSGKLGLTSLGTVSSETVSVYNDPTNRQDNANINALLEKQNRFTVEEKLQTPSFLTVNYTFSLTELSGGQTDTFSDGIIRTRAVHTPLLSPEPLVLGFAFYMRVVSGSVAMQVTGVDGVYPETYVRNGLHEHIVTDNDWHLYYMADYRALGYYINVVIGTELEISTVHLHRGIANIHPKTYNQVSN